MRDMSALNQVNLMNKIEKKILLWIEDHLLFMLFSICTLLGIIIRLALKDVVSGDFMAFL